MAQNVRMTYAVDSVNRPIADGTPVIVWRAIAWVTYDAGTPQLYQLTEFYNEEDARSCVENWRKRVSETIGRLPDRTREWNRGVEE